MQLKSIRDISPEVSTAYGAAVQGAVMGGSDKFNDVLCMDVYPSTLWFETINQTLKELIPRNSQIPYVNSYNFFTNKNTQTSLAIDIYEGEGTTSKENRFLGTLAVTDIPMTPQGFLIIEVLFEIDENSTLTVSAKDKITKRRFKIKFHKKIGVYPKRK